MLANIGMTEVLILGVTLLVLFGSKQLPVMARNLGENGKELKQATRDLQQAVTKDVE